MTPKPVCVGLVFTQGYAYYRGILRGIRRYVEAKPAWLFTSGAPGSRYLGAAKYRPDEKQADARYASG